MAGHPATDPIGSHQKIDLSLNPESLCQGILQPISPSKPPPMSLKPQEVAPLNALRRHVLSWLSDAFHAQETGGLSWHWSAFRARKAWQPSKEAIERFLLSHVPLQSDLLLVGGSAGWMMSSKWLSRFKSVTIIDIDPLARLFFALIHGKALKSSGTAWHFERRDALKELPQLLKEHPNALIFFDNVLGQQCFRLKDEELVERLLGQLKRTLQGRTWGSIHDVYSGPIDVASTPGKAPLIRPEHILSFDCQFGEMISKDAPIEHKAKAARSARAPEFEAQPKHMVLDGTKTSFEDGAQTLLQSVNASGEWQDHLSVEVFAPDTPSVMIPWFFKPNYCHWLQAAMVVN